MMIDHEYGQVVESLCEMDYRSVFCFTQAHDNSKKTSFKYNHLNVKMVHELDTYRVYAI